MTKRQAQDALDIQSGACNPRGIARALVASVDDDANSPPMARNAVDHSTASWLAGSRSYTSAATRLIMHQLIFILTGDSSGQLYGDSCDMETCPATRDHQDDRTAKWNADTANCKTASVDGSL